MSALETLPKDCRDRVADLTERRTHHETMAFTAADAEELAAWEDYLAEVDEINTLQA